jgi:tetratricopeptide (TPR) repeat protein
MAKRSCVYSRAWLFLLLFSLLFIAEPAKATEVKDNYDTLFDRARQNYKKGRYKDALKLYQKANGMKGETSLECLLDIAETYGKLRDYNNALKACDRLIQLSSNDMGFLAKAWNLRGNTLFNSARFGPRGADKNTLQKAEAAFREVL